jgi:hypothetical protein
MTESDETAVACARVARAFHGLISAALGQLRIFYEARIASVLLAARGDPSAAIAMLQQERDAALERMRHALEQEKERAVRAVRARRRKWRFRGTAFSPTRGLYPGLPYRARYPNP